MDTSLKVFRKQIVEKLLALIWRQWSALGLSGYSDREESGVVDPEALLLLSLTVARSDARLFDEILDWLVKNGDFVNVQRLRSLVKYYDYQAKQELSTIADFMALHSSSELKWKKLSKVFTGSSESLFFFMQDGRSVPAPAKNDELFKKHGFLRSPVRLRGLSRNFPAEGIPSILLRLRALLGVNMRCEILCGLGAVEEIHPSMLARWIGQNPRSIQSALSEMVLSGVVQVRTTAREKIYSLVPGILDSLLRPNGHTPWQNTAAFFRAMEILWLGLFNLRIKNNDKLLIASEFRVISKSMRPYLGEAGMAHLLRDGKKFTGDKYEVVFKEDIFKLLSRI